MTIPASERRGAGRGRRYAAIVWIIIASTSYALTYWPDFAERLRYLGQP